MNLTLAAVIALWAVGQTINLMNFGGVLAIGNLVDGATVAIENIHAHLPRGKPLATAARDGSAETTIRLHLRAPAGTHIGRREQIARQALQIIEREVGTDHVDITWGYVRAIPSSYSIHGVFQWSRGPEEAMLYVDLKDESGIEVE